MDEALREIMKENDAFLKNIFSEKELINRKKMGSCCSWDGDKTFIYGKRFKT